MGSSFFGGSGSSDRWQPGNAGWREGMACSSKRAQRRHAWTYPRDGPGTRSVPRDFIFVVCGNWTQRFGSKQNSGQCVSMGGTKKKKLGQKLAGPGIQLRRVALGQSKFEPLDSCPTQASCWNFFFFFVNVRFFYKCIESLERKMCAIFFSALSCCIGKFLNFFNLC